MYLDILNRLGVDQDYQCDGRMDRQTEWPLAIAHSNIVRRALINGLLLQLRYSTAFTFILSNFGTFFVGID